MQEWFESVGKKFVMAFVEGWLRWVGPAGENSLSCTVMLAFYSAREYYHIVRELPTGKGFADICMIPRKKYTQKPAVVIELKWTMRFLNTNIF